MRPRRLMTLLLLAAALPAQAQDSPAPEATSASTARTSVTAHDFMIATANPLASRGRPRRPRRRRQRRRCGDRGAARPQPRRAAELRPRRRRLHGLLGRRAGDPTFDGRETAPAAATPELLPRRRRQADASSTRRWSAAARSACPAPCACWRRCTSATASCPGRELFAPAIRLADDGFPISPRLNGAPRRASNARRRTTPRARLFLRGRRQAEGGRHHPEEPRPRRAPCAPSRARAPSRSTHGRDRRATSSRRSPATGQPGRHDPRRSRRLPGRGAAPVCGPYRAFAVCGMGPPSSGGVAVLQILGILERTSTSAAPRPGPQAAHLFAEAGRLAFADRAAISATPTS